MIGGYATAARWSRHYAETADRIGAGLRAAIADRAPEIRAFAAFRPEMSDFDLWWNWAESVPEVNAMRESLRTYDVGYFVSGQVQHAFLMAAGRR